MHHPTPCGGPIGSPSYLDVIDQTSKHLNQARGIAALLREYVHYALLEDEAIQHAAWALEDTLDRATVALRHLDKRQHL